MEGQDNYFLAGGAAELERLQLQARVLEPDAEAMLDQIGIQPGWRCIELGCGAMGILGPLSQRVGASGKVVRLDVDAKLLATARALVEGWNNFKLVEGDVYHFGPKPRV